MLNAEKLNYLSTKLNVQHGQEDLYMSNRHFTALDRLVSEKKLKVSQVPFTYAYLYLQTYMFRYAKYDNYVPSTGEIKEMLGYSPTLQKLDYIIKKGGLLDTEEITDTLFDFPVIQEWEDKQPVFTMLSSFNEGGNGYGTQWRKERGIKTNQSCKYPVYAFYGEGEEYLDANTDNNEGSFFDMSNTTNLDINIFMYCMSNEELETTGFYLYSYLKWKCDCSEGEVFGIGYDRLARDTGLSERTIKKYIKALREFNLIDCQSGQFVIFPKGEEVDKTLVEPNRYSVNPYRFFYEAKQDKELSKPVYVSVATIQKNMALTEQQNKEVADEMNRLFG